MSDQNQPPSYPGGQQQPPPLPVYGQTPPPYPAPTYPAPTYPVQGYGPTPSPYAHWGLRLAGYLLDSLLTTPALIVAEVGVAMADDPGVTSDTQAIGVVLAVVGFTFLAGFSIWNTIIRQGRTGSSLGKKWVGIAVISEQTARPIGGWPTFGRSLLHILDALPCYLGFLWPLWDKKKQTFADKIMKTVVVPIPKAPYQAG
ncbi:MAG: domain containing protein [Marmoricola sp.]|nr:domain containing protein [Marmoricola sp.]